MERVKAQVTDGGYVLGCKEYIYQEKGAKRTGQVMVIVNDSLLRASLEVKRCVEGYGAVDGESRKLKGSHTLYMVGTQDEAHSLQPWAWGVSKGKECPGAIKAMLEVLDPHCRQLTGQDLLWDKVMCDAHKGLRNGIASWYQGQEGHANTEPIFGMCSKHVWPAIKNYLNQHGLGGHAEDVVADLKLIASLGRDFVPAAADGDARFLAAWNVVKEVWHAKHEKRWDALAAYIQRT